MDAVESSTRSAKDGPARPLRIAVRSMWLLGIASVLCGLVIVVAFGYLNRYTRFRPYFIAGGLGIWFVPGVLLATCSVFLAQRSKTAAIAAIVVAFGQGVCAAVLLYFSVTLEPVSPIPVILAALWVAAIVQLIHHLWRSLAAIRHDAEFRRGFDLSGTPRRVLPLTPPAEQIEGGT